MLLELARMARAQARGALAALGIARPTHSCVLVGMSWVGRSRGWWGVFHWGSIRQAQVRSCYQSGALSSPALFLPSSVTVSALLCHFGQLRGLVQAPCPKPYTLLCFNVHVVLASVSVSTRLWLNVRVDVALLPAPHSPLFR